MRNCLPPLPWCPIPQKLLDVAWTIGTSNNRNEVPISHSERENVNQNLSQICRQRLENASDCLMRIRIKTLSQRLILFCFLMKILFFNLFFCFPIYSILAWFKEFFKVSLTMTAWETKWSITLTGLAFTLKMSIHVHLSSVRFFWPTSGLSKK